MTRRPVVAVVGSLDTKGEEFAYAVGLLKAAGVDPIMIDCGVIGAPPWSPDVSAEDVAKASGHSLAEFRARRDEPGARGEAIDAMGEGLAIIVPDMVAAGTVDGVFGIGGGQGSTMISAALRALPIGVPKVLLSTMSPDNAGGYFGERDIAFFYSVSDIAGLNRITRRVIANAAHAVAGMVTHLPTWDDDEKPLVGITMFGTTTRAAHRIQERLHAAGLETVVFHAVGSGGRALERMIASGEIAGVIDLTPSEVTDDLFGGIFGAGQARLRGAVQAGIPQVIAPGALGQITFGARDTVPAEYLDGDRVVLSHSPTVTIVRTNARESARVGAEIARRLQGARHTEVLLSLGGLSDYEMPGAPLHAPEADSALFASLRAALPDGIALLERPEDINDPAFADFVAERFLALWRASETDRTGPASRTRAATAKETSR